MPKDTPEKSAPQSGGSPTPPAAGVAPLSPLTEGSPVVKDATEASKVETPAVPVDEAAPNGRCEVCNKPKAMDRICPDRRCASRQAPEPESDKKGA